MSMGVIYSNGALTDSAGEVEFNGHTTELYIANKDTNAWVEVKLNGGPHSVWIPDGNGHQHGYTRIPGDYTRIQVMTAGATVAVYAIA